MTAIPGSPEAVVQAAGVVSDVQKVIADAGADVESAVAKIKATVIAGEKSSEVNALKSFIGTILKSGRGGACLALAGAVPVAFIFGSIAGVYMLAVLAVLIATSPGAVSMLTGSTKGEPGWAILLAVAVAGFAGAGLLWAFDHGAAAIVKGLL